MFYGCDRYPDCDFAVNNPPEKDHPCPECGSLLLRRPKSLRCWNCGAELDLEFNVTKSGDVEAEAAARAAKADGAGRARAPRSSKKAPAKKTTARKKTAAKKKKPAAKKTGDGTAAKPTANLQPTPPPEPAVEG